MSLLCCESECECRTYPDEVLLSDDRVLHNMLKIEERYCPNNSYFDCIQKEITPAMRKTVAEWMLEVSIYIITNTLHVICKISFGNTKLLTYELIFKKHLYLAVTQH